MQSERPMPPDSHSSINHNLAPGGIDSHALALAGSRNGVGPVGIALPGHSAVAVHPDELVGEGGARSQVEGGGPDGVGVGVTGSREGHSVGRVPTAERGDGANNLDVLAIGSGGLLVEDNRHRRGSSTRGTGGDDSREGGRSRRVDGAAALADGNICAGQVDLTGLERVPLEAQEGVTDVDVGKLDLLGDGETSSNRGVARPAGSIVNALAGATVTGIESIAGEPVVAPTRLTRGAVRAEAAVLARDVGAGKGAPLETVLGGLLLLVGGEIARCEELLDERLILADTVGEHATVVTIVVDAPLDVDGLARRVAGDGRVAPQPSARLVVVDAHAGVVTTGSTAANRSNVKIGPGRDRLENGALGAGVKASLLGPCVSTEVPENSQLAALTSEPRRVRLDGMVR